MIRVLCRAKDGHLVTASINPTHIIAIHDSDESENLSNSVITLANGVQYYDIRTMSEIEKLMEVAS